MENTDNGNSPVDTYWQSRPYFVASKNGAVNAMHLEMLHMVDEEMVVRRLMKDRDYEWFHNGLINNDFTMEECAEIADAYEKVALQLLEHVREIREAKYLTIDDVPPEMQGKYLDPSVFNYRG